MVIKILSVLGNIMNVELIHLKSKEFTRIMLMIYPETTLIKINWKLSTRLKQGLYQKLIKGWDL